MTYPIQKVLHFHEAKAKKNFELGTYAIMEKKDGWLLYCDYIDGKWGKLSSRAEREIPSVAYLNELIAKSLSPKENLRLIFEATIPNLPFHELNGVLNRKSEEASDVVLNLHDAIFLDRPELAFKERYKYANIAYGMLKVWLGHWVELIPILAVTSDEEFIYKYFNSILELGREGIVLKNWEAGYFFGKRNANMMKLKEEVTKDLAVVGMVEGEGKYQGTLGALIVQSRDGTKHQVSGMTDYERDLWWEDRASIIGKVVEVRAMKELEDGSLREPRYKACRFDKTLAEID
jgi:ATP-dependent DNA ligase